MTMKLNKNKYEVSARGSCSDDAKQDMSCCSSIRVRYLVSALITLVTCVTYFTRANLSIAIVSMVDQEFVRHVSQVHESNVTNVVAICEPSMDDLEEHEDHLGHHNKSNQSLHDPVKMEEVHGKRYQWDQSVQGFILGAFFYTYILFQMPAGIIAEKYGGRWVVAFCLAGSAIISLITPVITDLHYGVLIAARVVLGCCQCGVFPSLFGILCAWMPLQERSTAFSLLNVGAKVGACLPYFLSGLLVSLYGWPALFYVPGIVAVIMFFIFVLLVRSSPVDHPFISQKELHYIQTANQAGEEKQKPAIPWCRILTNKSVLAVAFFQFACFWILTIFYSLTPKYLNEVLQVGMSANGAINGGINLISLASLTTTGTISEIVIQKGILSRTNTRKAFSLISGLATAICFFLIPAMGCSISSLMILLFVASFLSGFTSGSDTPLASEMSKNFPSALFAFLNMTATSTGFIAPAFAGGVLQSYPDDVWRAWCIIFYVSAAIMVLATIVFVICVSAERQAFDLIDEPTANEEPITVWHPPSQNQLETNENNESQMCDENENEMPYAFTFVRPNERSVDGETNLKDAVTQTHDSAYF